MSEPDPNTVVPPNDSDQTGGTPPAATDPNNQGTPANSDDDEMVTIPRKDLKALQSSRDKNFEISRQTQSAVESLMKKDYVKEFLADPTNAQKYPDVEVEDLLIADDEDEVAALAEAQQQKVEKLVQKRLAKIEVAEPPTISSKDRAAKLKSLEKPQPGAFQKFLQIGSMKVTD